MQKESVNKVTKLYEILYFDFIIYEFRDFDDIMSIAHFADNFIHYSWVFSLINHEEKNFNYFSKI